MDATPSSQIEAGACLTARERDLTGLVVQGFSNKQIARQLGITEGTVKVHLHTIFGKLGVANRTALTMLVHRRQVLTAPSTPSQDRNSAGGSGSARPKSVEAAAAERRGGVPG